MSDVPLKEYIERLLSDREKAVEMATRSLEKRLELLNELRGDVLPRGEYNRAHDALMDRVRLLELSLVKTAVVVSLLTSIACGVIVGLILHFLKP